MENEHKPTLESEKDINLEYEALKRKLFIKKMVSRFVVFLILFILVYFLFIRKNQPKNVVVESIPEEVVEETTNLEHKEINTNKTEDSDLLKIPQLSPVADKDITNTSLGKNTSKLKTSQYNFEGLVAGHGNELIFYSCSSSEALLLLPNSPYYQQVYNRYNSLKIGNSVYGQIPIVFQGRIMPVVYQNLGSIYTQGVFIDRILGIDSPGICT